RARADRNWFAEGKVQLGIWVLHRGDEGEREGRACGLRAQADAGECGALYDPGVEGVGDEDSDCAGAVGRDRATNLCGAAASVAGECGTRARDGAERCGD